MTREFVVVACLTHLHASVSILMVMALRTTTKTAPWTRTSWWREHADVGNRKPIQMEMGSRTVLTDVLVTSSNGNPAFVTAAHPIPTAMAMVYSTVWTSALMTRIRRKEVHVIAAYQMHWIRIKMVNLIVLIAVRTIQS